MKNYSVLLLGCMLSSNSFAGIIYTSFESIESNVNSTKIRIDDFLPNPGVNNSIIDNIPNGVFTDAGIGFISDGLYADGTSSQLTSDMYTTGDPFTWLFVDPTDTSVKKTVSQLGFYVGSLSSNATASFYDIYDNLLDALTIPSGIIGHSVGFDAGTSIIHKVVLEHSSAWFIGSYTESIRLNDIVFIDEKVTNIPVPEPSSIMLLGSLLLILRRKVS